MEETNLEKKNTVKKRLTHEYIEETDMKNVRFRSTKHDIRNYASHWSQKLQNRCTSYPETKEKIEQKGVHTWRRQIWRKKNWKNTVKKRRKSNSTKNVRFRPPKQDIEKMQARKNQENKLIITNESLKSEITKQMHELSGNQKNLESKKKSKYHAYWRITFTLIGGDTHSVFWYSYLLIFI